VARHPRIGRALDAQGDLREVTARFGAGAYVLRYRIDGETIVIIRVRHSLERRG